MTSLLLLLLPYLSALLRARRPPPVSGRSEILPLVCETAGNRQPELTLSYLDLGLDLDVIEFGGAISKVKKKNGRWPTTYGSPLEARSSSSL